MEAGLRAEYGRLTPSQIKDPPERELLAIDKAGRTVMALDWPIEQRSAQCGARSLSVKADLTPDGAHTFGNSPFPETDITIAAEVGTPEPRKFRCSAHRMANP